MEEFSEEDNLTKKKGNYQNFITETVFLWSDNANSPDGPDKMVFRFSGFGGSDFTSSFQG